MKTQAEQPTAAEAHEGDDLTLEREAREVYEGLAEQRAEHVSDLERALAHERARIESFQRVVPVVPQLLGFTAKLAREAGQPEKADKLEQLAKFFDEEPSRRPEIAKEIAAMAQEQLEAELGAPVRLEVSGEAIAPKEGE